MTYSSFFQHLRWLCFFLLSTLSTASADEMLRLDFFDASLIALRQHPSLLIRADGILAAQHDLEAANWQRFPAASVDFGTALAQQGDGAGKADRQGMTLRIQQPVWSGGRIDAEVDGAKVRHALAEIDQRQAEQDVVLKVVDIYAERQRWHARLAIADENLAEHRRLLALIQRRSEQKISSQADLSLANARLQQALAEQQSFRLSEQKLLSNMQQVLGLTGQALQLAPLDVIALPDQNLQNVLQAARQASPRLARLSAEGDLARAEAAVRSAQRYPQLFLRYEKMTGSAQTVTSDRFMLAVEYQPGAGLGSWSAAEAAARRVAMADGGVALGERELHDRVADVFSEWKTYAEQKMTAHTYAEAARAVMASYLRQFTAGRKTWQEVLNAQREVAQAAYSAIDATHGEVLASHRLAVLSGLLTPSYLMQKKLTP